MDELTRLYPGTWNPATQFGVCFPHTSMNSGRNMFDMIGNSGKVAFTRKRAGLEEWLGGAKRMAALAGKQNRTILTFYRHKLTN